MNSLFSLNYQVRKHDLQEVLGGMAFECQRPVLSRMVAFSETARDRSSNLGLDPFEDRQTTLGNPNRHHVVGVDSGAACSLSSVSVNRYHALTVEKSSDVSRFGVGQFKITS